MGWRGCGTLQAAGAVGKGARKRVQGVFAAPPCCESGSTFGTPASRRSVRTQAWDDGWCVKPAVMAQAGRWHHACAGPKAVLCGTCGARHMLPGPRAATPHGPRLALRAAWHTSRSPSVIRWLIAPFSLSSRCTSSGNATACFNAGMAAARCRRTLATGSYASERTGSSRWACRAAERRLRQLEAWQGGASAQPVVNRRGATTECGATEQSGDLQLPMTEKVGNH